MFPRLFALILAGSLALAAPEAHAQRREIQGAVTTAQGAPLSGANVFLAGSSVGAVTDASGAFRLAVPAGDIRIRVTTIGFRARELTVPATQSTVNVQLEPDVLNLEGLVVTGQATTVARRNLANAVATVSAQELERAPAPSIDKALQGKIAGANIQTNSGAPGGGVQVNLRGVSSINGASEPLWVIDGMVVSNVAIASGANAITKASAGSNASNQDGPVNRIADINPRDIERIEVLKGASAAAIYGSQASNGVILITTKRGQSGAPRVNLTQRMGVSQLSNTIGMRQWTREKAAATFKGLTSAELDAYFAADGSPRQTFDQEKELAGRTPLSTETSFSVSGGLSDTRYFVSGLLLKDEGIIENTGFDKHSLRLNLNHRLGSRVEVDVSANVLHSLARRGLTNNDNAGASYYVALASTPNFVDLRRKDGLFPLNPLSDSNPLQTAALLNNDEAVWRGLSSASLSATFLENDQQKLQLRVNGGADYFQQRNDLFSPPELQFEPDDNQPGTSVLGNNSNLVLNGTANLIHTFTPTSGWLTATTSAGVQYADNDLLLSSIVGRTLVGGKRNRDAAASKEVFEARRRTRTLGLYAQKEVLLFDERMLLTASLRADRSSANGDTKKHYYYPKFAASYRFNELLPGLDELKLRTAFGASGNQPLFGQKFTPLDPTSNIQGLPALVVQGTAGDPNIRPEHTRELEGGLDATLLDGRGHLEFTLYRKNITDLLLQRTVAQSTGYTAQFFNGGELETKGIEIALDATPLQRGSASWISRITYAANRSRIVDLPVPTFRMGEGFGTSLGAFQIEVGRSATQIVGADRKDGKSIVRAMGDANPDFRMGFANDFGYGRFRLSSLVDWQKGGSLINLTKLLYDLGGNSPDFDLPAGVSAPRSVPECHPNCSGAERLAGFGTYTQQYIEDASFVKLREVSLTYDVPARWLGTRTGAIKSAQLSLSGRNLLTFAGYSGLDPEVSNFGNRSIARNIDVAPFPPSRSFWLTLDLGL